MSFVTSKKEEIIVSSWAKSKDLPSKYEILAKSLLSRMTWCLRFHGVYTERAECVRNDKRRNIMYVSGSSLLDPETRYVSCEQEYFSDLATSLACQEAGRWYRLLCTWLQCTWTIPEQAAQRWWPVHSQLGHGCGAGIFLTLRLPGASAQFSHADTRGQWWTGLVQVPPCDSFQPEGYGYMSDWTSMVMSFGGSLSSSRMWMSNIGEGEYPILLDDLYFIRKILMCKTRLGIWIAS